MMNFEARFLINSDAVTFAHPVPHGAKLDLGMYSLTLVANDIDEAMKKAIELENTSGRGALAELVRSR